MQSDIHPLGQPVHSIELREILCGSYPSGFPREMFFTWPGVRFFLCQHSVGVLPGNRGAQG